MVQIQPLAVLVIMSQRWEWLAVWAAAYVAFVFDHSTGVQVAAYGSALVVVALATLRRTRLRRRWGEPAETVPGLLRSRAG